MPSLRCAACAKTLGLAVPHADTLLEEISHPLLAKVTERFADDDTPQERIAAIDDQVLFKVKVQRWRGAVWVDAGIPWLVAAGQRKRDHPTISTPSWQPGARQQERDTTPGTPRR